MKYTKTKTVEFLLVLSEYITLESHKEGKDILQK